MFHIPATIRTSYGPSALCTRPMIRVTLTPAELHTLVRAIEGEAGDAEDEGRYALATTLAWRAAALREAGR